jgi:hypothetical protein
MIDFARDNDELLEVAQSGPWVVFEVTDSALVEGLANQPAVMAGLDNTAGAWLERSMEWYKDPQAWAVFLTDGGPDEWQRVEQGEQPAFRPQDPVTVSNITTTNDSIEFDVSEVGTPVLVKSSYFPNWKASGAEGPWRVTPNLMVVVPTEQHVELHYGWTGVDALGWGATALGLVGLVLLWRAGPVVMPPEPPRRTRRRRSDDDTSGEDEGDGDDREGGDLAAATFDPAEVILGPQSSQAPPPSPPPSSQPPPPASGSG